MKCRVTIAIAPDLLVCVLMRMTMIDVALLVATALAAMVTVTEALPVEATMMTVADMIALLLHGVEDLLTTTHHLLVLVGTRMLIAVTILHRIPT
jgi:hypothetical protein